MTVMAAALDDQQLLSRLVAFDTTSHRSNLEIVDFLCDYLDGVAVRLERLPDASGEKLNLVAVAGPPLENNQDRAGLTLSGHLDVVPATEPDWRSDPFILTEREGRLYGRGSCDMKASVAIFVNLIREYASRPIRGPLAVVLSHDEEVGSLGAERLAREWPGAKTLPAATLVGEPTSLQAIRMHKGHLKMRIVLRGQSAHSGSPHLGVNAIEPLGALLVALNTLRESFEKERAETSGFFPTVPHPVFGVTTVRGGTALNFVPDRCEVTLGIRLLPGQLPSPEGVIERVQETIDAVLQIDHNIEIINDNPPMFTPDEAPIHRALCERIGQSESLGASFASDGGMFNGHLDMDCVLLGPGSIEVAHRPNEFVPIDQMQAARDIFSAMIERFCMR